MTKAICHEIWKGYARQPVIMSQFPCLAAASPENIDASIAPCQSIGTLALSGVLAGTAVAPCWELQFH